MHPVDIKSIPPEGPEDEWKEKVPRPNRMARTLAAFSNGTGGRIWVGMRDDGQPLGVPNFDTVRRAMNEAAALVDPAPQISFHRVSLGDGRSLLRVDVRSGSEGPYCVVGREGERVAYLRNRDITRPIPESEIGRMRKNSKHFSLQEKDWRLLILLEGSDGMRLNELARHTRMGEREARRRMVALHQASLTSEVEGRGHVLTPRGFKRCRERGASGP
jgi:predicted HTH transcriptional regulator